MDHADGVIEGLAIDRKARMARIGHQTRQFLEGRVDLHRDDIGARHHHVLDALGVKLAQIEEQIAARRRRLGLAGGAVGQHGSIVPVGVGGAPEYGRETRYQAAACVSVRHGPSTAA